MREEDRRVVPTYLPFIHGGPLFALWSMLSSRPLSYACLPL